MLYLLVHRVTRRLNMFCMVENERARQLLYVCRLVSVHCIMGTSRAESIFRTLIVPYSFISICGLKSHIHPTFLLSAHSSCNKERGNPIQHNKTLFYKDVTRKMQRRLGTGWFRNLPNITEGLERVLSHGIHNLMPVN
jgi:hypothetical protein